MNTGKLGNILLSAIDQKVHRIKLLLYKNIHSCHLFFFIAVIHIKQFLNGSIQETQTASTDCDRHHSIS